MLREFFQQGRRYSYGTRDRLLLLSLRQVCPADAIVPAKAVNVHQSPEQPHDQGSRRKIEAQNTTAATSQGWRRSFERAEANSRQLHSGGFPAVNQEQVLIARPEQDRHQPCRQQHRFGEGQLRQHLMADQGKDNRSNGHQRAIHQSGTEASKLAFTKPVLLTAGLVPVLLWASYQYLLLVYGGKTAGMQLTRIRLSTFKGAPPSLRRRRSRVLGLYFSTASLVMGLLWALVDVDRLCWHDRISGTYLTKRE